MIVRHMERMGGGRRGEGGNSGRWRADNYLVHEADPFFRVPHTPLREGLADARAGLRVEHELHQNLQGTEADRYFTPLPTRFDPSSFSPQGPHGESRSMRHKAQTSIHCLRTSAISQAHLTLSLRFCAWALRHYRRLQYLGLCHSAPLSPSTRGTPFCFYPLFLCLSIPLSVFLPACLVARLVHSPYTR